MSTFETRDEAEQYDDAKKAYNVTKSAFDEAAKARKIAWNVLVAAAKERVAARTHHDWPEAGVDRLREAVAKTTKDPGEQAVTSNKTEQFSETWKAYIRARAIARKACVDVEKARVTATAKVYATTWKAYNAAQNAYTAARKAYIAAQKARDD